ncbi:MAG: hypothetical protein ACRCWS_00310 [Propionibacteriaceae bacterium]
MLTWALIIIGATALAMLAIGVLIIGYCATVCRAIDSSYETNGQRDDIA